MEGEALYLSIIGDLISSRTITDRGSAQTQFQATLDRVNDRFKDHLASVFTITLGDEFQGVLKPQAPVFQILDWVEAGLHPHPCRFGIGLGVLLTPLRPELSIGADGPAFWHARNAINQVHEHDDYGQTRTRFVGCNENDAPLINNLLAVSDSIKRGFTALQQETFFMLLHQDIYSDTFDQQKAAREMKITPEALYRRLKISGIKLYFRCRADLQVWLNRYLCRRGQDTQCSFTCSPSWLQSRNS